MKKLLVIIVASICLLGVAPQYAFASGYEDQDEDPCAKAGFDDPMLCGKKGAHEEEELQGTVGNILLTVFGVIGVIAVIFIVIGGYKYTLSQGEPAKVQQAKSTIMYSLIGLIVTLSAFAITGFALGAFGSSGSGTGGGGGTQITSLEITSSSSMLIGETLQVTVKILPDYAEDKSLTFESSDTNLAAINEKGKVTAYKAGTTKITVKSTNGVSASQYITVIDGDSGSGTTKVKINPSDITIAVGESKTLKATVEPSGSCTVKWSSGNTSVATVDDSGVVKGISDGSITVTAKCGGASATASVKVGNGAAPTEHYSATFEKRNYTHSNGKSYDYWINVPEGATNNMPILIFLHGDGEMNNANKVKNLGQVQHIKSGKGYIGIAPVGKNRDVDWASSASQAAIKGLIEKVAADFKSDKSKIYIWGFSRGAIGTWQLVNNNPGYFRAAVPVSCCAKISITPANFKNTRVYALAGSAESDYISCMRSNVNKITAAGGVATFETVSGANHSTITGKFPYSKVIDNWLLKQ